LKAVLDIDKVHTFPLEDMRCMVQETADTGGEQPEVL